MTHPSQRQAWRMALPQCVHVHRWRKSFDGQRLLSVAKLNPGHRPNILLSEQGTGMGVFVSMLQLSLL